MDNGQEITMTQTQAAKFLGVSDRTLRTWTRSGKVRAGKPNGGKVIYLLSELKAVARPKCQNA